jgi:hypothetical protein
MLVLLPGMDRTGKLFEAFVGELPRHVVVVTVSCPVHGRLSYAGAKILNRAPGQLKSNRPGV